MVHIDEIQFLLQETNEEFCKKFLCYLGNPQLAKKLFNEHNTVLLLVCTATMDVNLAATQLHQTHLGLQLIDPTVVEDYLLQDPLTQQNILAEVQTFDKRTKESE